MQTQNACLLNGGFHCNCCPLSSSREMHPHLHLWTVLEWRVTVWTAARTDQQPLCRLDFAGLGGAGCAWGLCVGLCFPWSRLLATQGFPLEMLLGAHASHLFLFTSPRLSLEDYLTTLFIYLFLLKKFFFKTFLFIFETGRDRA